MNRFYCEKEAEILEALRHGALYPEHAKHAANCAICADTLAVSEFLQGDTGTAPALPDSDFLWWKAQLVRKQMAVERATRSIALVKKLSYFGAAAAGLWLAFAPGPLGSILSVLSRHEIWPAGALTQTALLLGVGALVFTLLGSLYLARPEK
jgi:hypothetical protein